MHFDMVLPWRLLYSVLQRLLFSNSKTSVHKTMPVFFRTFLPFLRSCNSMFAETATEEIIALWRPLLDPHHSYFVMTHCLLCLFLPTHTGKHHLWFSDFLSIWPMYRAAHWDYQWIFLFARLSMHDFDDIEWAQHLPFLFSSIASYLAVPYSLLDIPMDQVNDYPVDNYKVFFMDCPSVSEIFPYCSYLSTNLLTNAKAKAAVRTHFERLCFLIQPFYSPTSQADDASDVNLTVVFLSALINTYLKHVRMERKYSKHRLPMLTEDDHDWFLQVVAPLVLMERFTDSPEITSIIKAKR
jgi:hypothetical protein